MPKLEIGEWELIHIRASKVGDISITTKHWILVQDLIILLKSLNLFYSIEATYNKTYNRDYYRILILAKSLLASSMAAFLFGSDTMGM